MPLPLVNRNINMAFVSVESYDHFPNAVHLFRIGTGFSDRAATGIERSSHGPPMTHITNFTTQKRGNPMTQRAVCCHS